MRLIEVLASELTRKAIELQSLLNLLIVRDLKKNSLQL